MGRGALIAAAALAAAAGMGAVVAPTAQAEGAREARQGLDRQDRNRGPGGAPLNAIERAALRMGGGGWIGSAGGYRKRPRGSHKQNRRQLLAKRTT